MRTILTSILVGDQDKALKYYTEVLGFIKKKEIPMGNAKWLTVVSSEGPEDVEILLEPNWNPAIQIMVSLQLPNGRRYCLMQVYPQRYLELPIQRKNTKDCKMQV